MWPRPGSAKERSTQVWLELLKFWTVSRFSVVEALLIPALVGKVGPAEAFGVYSM